SPAFSPKYSYTRMIAPAPSRLLDEIRSKTFSHPFRNLLYSSANKRSLAGQAMIRSATIHDVPRIQEIINSHAELGKMLFKSLAQLYENLRDFAVYEADD